MLLKELTRLFGPSGEEGEVRRFVIDHAAPYADKIDVDNMGSVIAWKYAKQNKENAKTVMIAAHMDEVGFLVQYVRDDGLIRYMTVGGIDPAVCVSKRVLVGKNRVPGVIGCMAVHLQERDARSTALKHSQLYIDIGAKKLVLETLVRLNREQGMTIVMVSSELMELRSICDRIAIVAEGEVVDVLPVNSPDADFGLAMSGIKPGKES